MGFFVLSNYRLIEPSSGGLSEDCNRAIIRRIVGHMHVTLRI